MANTSFEDRRLARVDLAERAEALAKRHRADAALYERKGNPEKLAKAEAAAEHQEGIARRLRAEIERLKKRASADAYLQESAQKAKAAIKARAEAQKERLPQVDPLEAYMQAIREATRLEAELVNLRARLDGLLRVGDEKRSAGVAYKIEKRVGWVADWHKEAGKLIASSGRDLDAEARAIMAGLERQHAQETQEAQHRRRHGLPDDLRTAGAQREFVEGGEGRNATTLLAEYATLIPRAADRTHIRVWAMQKLDGLCSWAEEGLYPTVDLLKGGGGSGKPGAYLDGYAGGMDAIEDIKRAIGVRNFDMLKARIYERQTLTALSRAGYGPEKTIGLLTLAAIDALVAHFKGRGRQNPAPILAGRRAIASAKADPAQ